MQSIQDSFSRKRTLHYDHYDRFNDRANHYSTPSDQHSNGNSNSNNYTYTPNASSGPSSRRPYPMPSTSNYDRSSPPVALTSDPNFDILDWHPAYQSCQRFFLDHAQHEPATQALCALVNIRLPFQYLSNPIESATPASLPPQANQAGSAYTYSYPRSGASPPRGNRGSPHHEPPVFVSLIPYIKRLVVTGFDKPAILHGLFGDDYKKGVLPHLDCERRNYLFAAKHGGWSCKRSYDSGTGMGGDESVPFMKPLEEARGVELMAAEKAWSGWLAMEDWMVGPRAPRDEGERERGGGGRSERGEGNGAGVRGGELLPDGVCDAFEEQFRDNHGSGSGANGHSLDEVRETRESRDTNETAVEA